MSPFASKVLVELIVAVIIALVIYFWSSLSGYAMRAWNETARGVGATAGGNGNGTGGGFPLTPAPSDLLSTGGGGGGQESFVNGGNSAAVAPAAAPAGSSTLVPSDLLPTDGNTLWNTVGAATTSGSGGGADLSGQIVPAELMDPTRMPHYTSTSKSKIPNQQWWRPDPLVDRSLASSQWFNQAPDTHQDVGAGVPNPNVDVSALRAVPL